MTTLAWPESSEGPVVLQSMLRPPRDGSLEEVRDSFVEAVAGAYEAGLEVSFEGLYEGEMRRRISLPGYPFQRQRYWIETPRRRRPSDSHPLLGVRDESPRGEVLFETEMFPSDPGWLNDHRVFGRVVTPGAVYGAMAASASLAEGAGSIVVEDLQLQSPLVFPEHDSEDGSTEEGRRVQLVLDGSNGALSRRFEIFSRGDAEDGWTLHAEGQVSSGGDRQASARIDLDGLKAGLSAGDASAFITAPGPKPILNWAPGFARSRLSGRTRVRLSARWLSPEAVDGTVLDLHPILLDGCFQVMAAARNLAGGQDGATYLPFGWDRLWLAERLPERVVCHARLRERARDPAREGAESGLPEVLTGDLRFYTPDGLELGGLDGYTVKRATRAALLSATEDLSDLLYEVVWQDRALAPGMPSADFFPSPAGVAAGAQLFTGYLTEVGVDPEGRNALLADLERWSHSRALATLEELGWQRVTGEAVDPEILQATV